jgi:hypothetical protein
MAFGGNMNVAAGLIGGWVGVAVSGLSIWLKRPQYTEHESLVAVGKGSQTQFGASVPDRRGNGTADSRER